MTAFQFFRLHAGSVASAAKSHLSRHWRTILFAIYPLTFAVSVLAGGSPLLSAAPGIAHEDNSTATLHGPAPGTRGVPGTGLLPWETVTPAPTEVSRPGGAVVGGLLYVIGGEESGGVRTGIVQIYDPETDDWDTSSADAMPLPASNLCAAVVEGLIYVPGGWTGADVLETLQVFDPATGTWETMDDDPLPAGRYGSACAAHDGRLYVFGGWDGGAGTGGAWVYDPEETPGDRWSILQPSSLSHVYAAALSVNGLIFVAGFSDNFGADLDTVAAYDPNGDEWIAYPSLQTPRGGAGMWALGDQLYVGGGGWSSFLISVEMYDTATGDAGNWEPAPSLNQGRRTFAYATDPENNRLYAAAGWASAFLGNTELTGLPPAPVVLSVSPDSGPEAGGTQVTISGENFDAAANAAVGGNDCIDIVVVDGNTITCETPPGIAGPADVTVENPDSQSGTLTGGFTYVAAPSIIEVSPGSGPESGGTPVTITGSAFQGAAAVTFGGSFCVDIDVLDENTITCETPPGLAGPVDVMVENPDSQSDTLAGGFTYVAPPSIASVNPGAGPESGGTTVTIGGDAFQAGAVITFGGKPCTGVDVPDENTITCVTPPGPLGPVDVTVENPDGQSDTLIDGFDYLPGEIFDDRFEEL